jgi:uncharacterized glyoxalase superfamily metalloenzyme YdcJ
MVLANKVQMQHKLFAALSDLFGREVPMYDKSLLVNSICNRTACELLGAMFDGFSLSDQELERTSGERHGAIRIGRPDEYRWVARFFAQFGMEPHNFYDMANVGAKSQPIIATAFRSVENPDHRVFTSLLLTDYFDEKTRARIEGLLSTRQVFSEEAKALIEKAERQGGLEWADAEALIREGIDRIFKWTGRAKDHGLYKELCDAGFKIAADIACFERHHLNHLTPNTLCMDLYTSAMKRCMGELDAKEFAVRATRALKELSEDADHDWMHLHFKHIPGNQIFAMHRRPAEAGLVERLVAKISARLSERDTDLTVLKHSGFKDSTEGPSEDTPVLLRQDAYKALTEAVVFTNPDGTQVSSTHTARFGEIEQRFYATTKKGRELFDACLMKAEAEREQDPGLGKRDYAAAQAKYRAAFTPFPKCLSGLIEQGLVYARYVATPKGVAARGTIATHDLRELVRAGFARAEGLRYEDFLPVSAAGIFASNLNQYGTKTTAASRPVYTQSRLEEIMGKKIIDAEAVYRGMEAGSTLRMYADLGLLDTLPAGRRQELETLSGVATRAMSASA